MTEKVTRAATSNTGSLLFLAAAALLAVAVAQGQLAHQGPVKAIALAQTIAPYDVSSIKQNKTGDHSWGMNLHDDIFTANNVPLEAIIEFAYDTHHITGLTGSVTSLSFDVMAKVLPATGGTPVKLTDQQLQAMIIPLLADRFQLKAHVEPKITTVYDLIVRNGGLKLKLDTSENLGGGGWDIHGENTEKVLTGKNVSLADLAEALSDIAERRVIDKTGLAGRTDITLKWTDDVAAQPGGDVISIFTAVEEQLGLKLQPSKGPVDILVIDHAELPSAN